MRDCTQLTQEERHQIAALLKASHGQSEIATVLKRHKSTISREVRRNRGLRGCRPKQAQRLALAHHEARSGRGLLAESGSGLRPAARGLESGAGQRLAVGGAGAGCQS